MANDFKKYPYQDFNAFNLDWILEKVDVAEKAVSELNENAREIIVETLTEWLNDGTLSDIITEDVLTQISENTDNINKILEGRKFVLIGDSLGEGYTVGGFVTSWIEIAKTHLNVIGDKARGGSAFSRPTPNNFLDRLTEITADISEATDIVVLGGANESFESVYACQAGIQAFCNYCKTHYPKAVVHIGWIGYSNIQASRWNMRAYKNAYFNCGIYGASYLSNIHNSFFDNSLVATGDTVHASTEGQQHIASALITILNGGDYHYIVPLEVITKDTSIIDMAGNYWYIGRYDNTIQMMITQPQSIDLTGAANVGNVRENYVKIGTFNNSPVPANNNIEIIRFNTWMGLTGSGFTPYNTQAAIMLNGNDIMLKIFGKTEDGAGVGQFANWGDYRSMWSEWNVTGEFKMPF